LNTIVLEQLYYDVQDISARLSTVSGGGGGGDVTQGEFQELSGVTYNLSGMVWDMSAYLYTVSGTGSGGPTGYPTLGDYGP
jgi:hypothetical protein